MSGKQVPLPLTKRERQIMDVLYRLGRATAAEVMSESMERRAIRPCGPSSGSSSGSVRSGTRKRDCATSTCRPCPGTRASIGAEAPGGHLRVGSTTKAVAALLGGEASPVSEEDLSRIEDLVKNARIEELCEKRQERAAVMLRRPLLLALMLAAAAPVRAQDIDDFVRGWIEKQHVPAAVIAVVKDGALIRVEGYGLADVENRIPARAETVFKIGSLSKQFIATGDHAARPGWPAGGGRPGQHAHLRDAQHVGGDHASPSC